MALVLDRNTVLECIDPSALVDDIAKGMIALSQGRAVQPLRTRVFSPKTQGLLASLPCYLEGEELFSAKIGFSHPTLRSPDGTRHLTQVIAFGNTEGHLFSIMHGTMLGMYRTAACSALAARLLSQPEASHLAILGCGPMGRTEAEVMATVRLIRKITIHDVNSTAADLARTEIEKKTGIDVQICPSNEEAVKGADIVSLATTSVEPIIARQWVKDDCHISALGAHRKDHREVDGATIAEAGLFIESEPALMAEAGDYLIPLKDGLLPEDHFVAEIGKVAAGEIDASKWTNRLTVFKSTGVGIQDLVIARHVYDRAKRLNAGINVEF